VRPSDFPNRPLQTFNPKQKCHPACPGLPWDRSVAQWRDLQYLSTTSSTVDTTTAHPYIVVDMTTTPSPADNFEC
jgi:hypothetical protein